jgi:glyceraldehyde 3-phosphate dehydrogenase
MTTRLAINGFGRIGRLALRALAEGKYDDIEVVALNDLADARTLAHLLKYDSVHGRFPGDVSASENAIVVNGKSIPLYAEKTPSSLPWRERGVDVVLESTGRFVAKKDAQGHIDAGAKRVVISAPGKEVDATICMGVNEGTLRPEHTIISNASCTTNCLAPVAKVLHDNFGIVNGSMVTVHAYTNDQQILDAPHKDLRRARAGAAAIIPTSTGAAKAVGLVLPELKGRLNGSALRVPVPNGSCVFLTVNLEKATTADAINDAMREAARGPMKGILAIAEDPIVHLDIVHDPHSSIFDALSTMMVGEKTASVLSWYDNEWGYANRCVDAIRLIAREG